MISLRYIIFLETILVWVSLEAKNWVQIVYLGGRHRVGGTSREVEMWERKEEEAQEGCISELVTTVGSWSSILVGSCGRRCGTCPRFSQLRD